MKSDQLGHGAHRYIGLFLFLHLSTKFYPMCGPPFWTWTKTAMFKCEKSFTRCWKFKMSKLKIFNLFIVGFNLEGTFILEAGTYPVVMSLIQVKNGLSPMLTPALVVPCWWDQLTSLEVLSGWSLVWRMK